MIACGRLFDLAPIPGCTLRLDDDDIFLHVWYPYAKEVDSASVRMMDGMTIAQSNDDALRGYLRMRREPGWSKRRYKALLNNRRRYRSDKPMKVWVVSTDDGRKLYFERRRDLYDITDGWQDVIVEEVWMTGREFGRLPVSLDM